MRVLATLDAVGGVWRHAMDLAAGLGPLGVETCFLGFGPAPSAAQREEARALGPLDWSGAPLDWLAADEAALSPVPGIIAATARARGADILHLNLPTQAAGLAADLPVVAVSHSCVSTWFRAVRGTGLPAGWEWQGRLNAAGLRRADAAVAPSRAHADALRAAYGPLPSLRVVHNATLAPEGVPGDAPYVVAAGRWWDEGKGGATLDAAAARASWPVRMMGPTRGPNGATFEPAHARREGVLPHAGAVALMQGAAIFVSPSLYEPFGLAVAEAARAGLPLILSDIPTFRELWDGAALFSPPGDAAALAGLIERLAAGADERRRLGAAARARAARFTPGAQARAMLAVYEDVLARRAPLRQAV